jgi:DNA-binding transcriptional LysR family regulator
MAKTTHSPTLDFGHLSFYEIEIFLDVARELSLRQVARTRKMEPSQVSRIIRRIEDSLKFRLMERSARGMVLTRYGSELVPLLTKLSSQVDEVYSTVISNKKQNQQKSLAIGSTSFLTSFVLSRVVAQISSKNMQTNFQLLDLGPDQLVQIGMRGGFEACVHIGSLDWPKTWVTQSLGPLRWALFARNSLAKRLRPSEVLDTPFIYPNYWTPQGLAIGNDHCPVPLKKRIRGIGTASAESALSVLLETDQLAYLPEILVRTGSRRNAVQEIAMPGWDAVVKPVFMSLNSGVVTDQMAKQLAAAIRVYLVE